MKPVMTLKKIARLYVSHIKEAIDQVESDPAIKGSGLLNENTYLLLKRTLMDFRRNLYEQPESIMHGIGPIYFYSFYIAGFIKGKGLKVKVKLSKDLGTFIIGEPL